MEKIKNKKIAISGGAGLIGSHLVDLLIEDNFVMVIDNFTSGSKENLKSHYNNDNMHIIQCDIRNKSKMIELTKGIDCIYHLAAECLRISIANPELVHEVNSTGTLNMCNAALKNEVEKFVYISTSEVYGTCKEIPMGEGHPLEPTTIYGASKLAAEKYVKAFHITYGLPVVIVRPFNTYGPRARFDGVYGEVIPRFTLRALHGLPPVIFGDGLQTRDFTYVEDTALGILSASQCHTLLGQEINIGSGREISILDLAHLVLDITGRNDLSVEFAETRPGDVRRHVSDTTKISAYCKLGVRKSLREGLLRYLEWIHTQTIDMDKLPAIANW